MSMIENKATRAIQRMRAAYDRALSDLNMTSRQLVVLRYFNRNPGAHQGAAVTETGIDRSTLADIMARLDERGLVNRKRSKDDARANCVFVTAAGNKAVERADLIIASADERLLSGLSPQNCRVLETLLDRIGTEEAA